MTRKQILVLSLLIVTFGSVTAAQAGWVHYSTSMNQPAKNLKHTATLEQMLIVPVDVAEAQVCVFYSNTTSKKNKGRVVAEARMFDTDGEEIVLKYAGGVNKNAYEKCKAGPALEAGSTVYFSYEFKGMPRVLGKQDQYFEVAGVVSDSGEPEFDRVPVRSTDADETGWIHSASSLFFNDKETEKHPAKLSQTLVLTTEAASSKVCVAYANTLADGKRGKVTSTINVVRADGTEKLKLTGGVSNNIYENCKDLGDVGQAEMVTWDMELKNFPRLRGEGSSKDFVDINAVVSTAGDVQFEPAPENPSTPTDPDDPTDPGETPPPSGGLSGADQVCISKVLYIGSGAAQIVRPRGNKGGKFEIFGPRSVYANGEVDPATVGFGSTYAAACADYERKRGSLGPNGPALSSRDIDNWVWYSNMNSAAGPTAVRRDPRGGFHADYYRPSLGAIIVDVASPWAAIEALKRAGL